MIEAVPKGFFSKGYLLQDEGRTVADLDVSMFREKAEVEIGGRLFTLRRDGLLSSTFVMEENGVPILDAVKPSVFSRSFEVHLEGRVLVLRRERLFSRDFGIYDGDRRLGGVGRAGLFTRHARVDLPREWHVGIHVFIFWLVLVIWNRDRRAASS